jgi:hypothetical protein
MSRVVAVPTDTFGQLWASTEIFCEIVVSS